MEDKNKTKTQLIAELEKLRKQINAEGIVKKDQDIKERKSKIVLEQLWEIYSISLIPTLILSKNGKIVKYNKSIKKLTGFTHKEVPDIESWMSKIYPDKKYRNQVIKFDKKSRLRQINVLKEELLITRKSGEKRTVEFFVTNIIHDGKPIDLQIVQAIDITERKNAEEKISAITQKSPIPTAVGGSDGSIISFNDALERLIGYKRAEITDVKDWANKLYPDKGYRDFVWNNIQQALRGEKQECNEFTITCKDGATKVIDYYTSFFHSGIIIQMVDITKRKKAEERIEFLSSITENITDSILVTDTNFTITYANKTFEELYGYTLLSRRINMLHN